ncbi:triose-phosphate isomerase [Candidatus Pelagibacter sp. Uisw_134_02]|jgi:triosephosphate isomerase (TIM)|uniref:triose-phosphate isomerase n=1 Tax=Candidatus Pelagibacter sp. Uisw_134_02 TaxID=3230990 RepID=UPI0039ED8F1C
MTNKYMYFVANWKMYGNLSSLNTLDKVIKFSKSKEIKRGRLIYCPPNTLISSFSKKFRNCQIGIGGQNCHESKNYGAHTGFVNCHMLKNIGAHFVIIGHSENREKGESDKLINQKIKSALEAKLKVIFCIGETLNEKRKKKTYSILSKQIKTGLKNIKNKSNIFLAYEPVWAIGSGIIPKPQDLLKTVKFIKNKFKDRSTKVLYGGSVNPQNITNLREINNIDGFLIGGASQNAKKFIDIVKKTYT